MSKDVDSEVKQNLEEVGEAKEGIIGDGFGELFSCASESEDDDEKEVTSDVPVKVVKVSGIAVVYLIDDGGGVLSQGVTSHDVEQGEVGG